ncbi:MAG: ATP-binding cassette domain-containing protein [Candidatus Pacebacteria bacterium]|nr:ATP-binding cassette domain-containing protein [Candidatus Paceibacterota bacterium]
MSKIYQTFYRFLLRYKKEFVVFVICQLIFSIAHNILPYFYKVFLEAIPGSNFKQLIGILIAYFLVRFIALVFRAVAMWWGDKVVIPAARDARLTIFKKVQDLDFAFHLNKSTGSLISAFKRGDLAFFNLHHVLNTRSSQVVVGFLVMLILFGQLNWAIVGLMIISISVNLLLAAWLIKRNIKARTEFNRYEDKLSGVITDNLINYETVKLFAKETQELQRLRQKFVTWTKKIWAYAYSFYAIDLSVGTLTNLGLFAILLLGIYQVQQTELSIAEYVMVLGFVTSFYQSFFELIYELRNLAKHHADIERYFSVLNQEIQVKDPIKPVKKTTVRGEIEFKQVSFSYPEGKQDAVNRINLKIKPGQAVAFVGHSGVGKTTMVKLLMRFYDPDQGEILLDGINIKRFSKDQLRSFMGVVPQDPIMFNNTVSFNIGYGNDQAAKKEIIAATKMAQLHDFIKTLPQGYQTSVGERGVKLSGGQKQRLAIARMILANPDVIIFDEATSQLDSESEQKIQQAFWQARANKTTLIIAHRLSSIVRADKIVVMKAGYIHEVGSHRELINKKDSLYQRFWQLQSQNKDNILKL